MQTTLNTENRVAPSPHKSARAARILLVDHTAQMSGGEIALLNLTKELNRELYSPVVLLFSDGPLVSCLRECGVETCVVPLSGNVLNTRKDSLGFSSLLKLLSIVTIGFYILKLCRVVRSLNVQVMHTNSLKAHIIGGLVGRILGIPVIWHIRDSISNDYLPSPVASALRLMCRLIPNFVIANSSATMQTLQLNCAPAQQNNNAFVVWDGTPVNVARSKLPQQPPTQSATQTIALIGRISPWKGQDVFLHAAALLCSQFPQTKFLIVGKAMFGEHEYERSLHELVAKEDLAQQVEFVGFTDDVPALLAQVDIVVHASTMAEPFGQVVIEAMAAGKPVVATRGGGVTEIIVDGECGILVPMGDAQAMAAAIERLLKDPHRSRLMGEKGYERVRRHFSIQNTAAKVQEVYSRAAKSAGK
ncbi:MAG TPA: glycosyltransferase family 4 protein [Trichormus sp.]|jgi:glycosyltransferase involved in cell wall biosynthesis